MNASRIAVSFVCVLAVLVAYSCSEHVRTSVRWFAHSQQYKINVLAQKQAGKGNVKHIEWDGWGGLGAGETTMYLAYDPKDALSSDVAASGKIDDLPCKVWEVRRLERGWYTVRFYTDTEWDNC